ncbi:MAG: hypothetical protein O9264_12365 [Leptospira sp.]|nr:hypothetical protein [Leptospira sp.]
MYSKQMLNRNSFSEKTIIQIFCGCLFFYGIYGLINNDLVLPGIHGPNAHFTGMGAFFIFISFLFFIFCFLSLFVKEEDPAYPKKIINSYGYLAFAILFMFIGIIIKLLKL